MSLRLRQSDAKNGTHKYWVTFCQCLAVNSYPRTLCFWRLMSLAFCRTCSSRVCVLLPPEKQRGMVKSCLNINFYHIGPLNTGLLVYVFVCVHACRERWIYTEMDAKNAGNVSCLRINARKCNKLGKKGLKRCWKRIHDSEERENTI